MLAADANDNLILCVGQMIVAGELPDNRGLQLGCASDIGIFGLAIADGGDGRFLDEIRRIEIGFTG